MRWPIRNQIFLPFASLLLITVASIAVTMAALAAHHSSEEQIERVHRVASTLADTSFPLSDTVLQKMRGLSGADFIALDQNQAIVTSTFGSLVRESDLPARLPIAGPPKRLEEFDPIRVAGQPYYAAVLPGHPISGVASLLILYPQENLRNARWQAAWPPLAIGGVTILLMVAVSAWLSRRLARRIETVHRQFINIAEGHFSHADAQPPFDEVYDLVESANQLADRLSTSQEQIARTERLRLLAQLAGGLAHQLRNAVTGARMAVQLHQRRCPREADESLDVALRQLSLMEEQIRGLLSLGKPEPQPPVPNNLSQILAEIDRLVDPAARHAHVDWNCELPVESADISITNSQNVRAGLLNLVLNAVQAAGSGGRVRLTTERSATHVLIHIVDTGSGPPESIVNTMYEPFMTSKPEGIGLGLALAQAAAREHGGRVAFERFDNQTRFTLSLAVDETTAPISEPAALNAVAR